MICPNAGIGVKCNICQKMGPLIRYDATRYQYAANGRISNYMHTIHNQAVKEAISEGFLALDEPEVDVGEDEQIDEAYPQAPVQYDNSYQLTKHICHSCLGDISVQFFKKKKKK